MEPTTAKIKEVHKWMRLNADEATNDIGEISPTILGEQAADAFNIYEDEIDYQIPDWIFELSLEVIEEIRQGECESAQARSEDWSFNRE